LAEAEISSEIGWEPVVPISELPEGKGVRVSVGDADVLLVRSGQVVFAVGDRCTHQGAPLHRGVVRLAGSVKTVTCPVHGSVFALDHGRVARGPATLPLPAFEVRIAGDAVEIRVPG
jgi:nitrite reductase/ring-hydroxylating ferredoxin subunit